MIYTLIHQGQKKAITQACRVRQVSRSGYYAARHRAENPTICTDSLQVKAAFVAGQGCYGSRRVVATLQDNNIAIGRFQSTPLDA